MSEHGPLQVVIHIGAQGLAGYLVPVMMLLCGILLWFNPGQRAFNSVFAMVLALLSWITSNLGGFFIGMLLGLVGGALAFAWTPGSGRQPLSSPDSDPQIRQWGLALILRPAGVLLPDDHAIQVERISSPDSPLSLPSSADEVAGSPDPPGAF